MRNIMRLLLVLAVLAVTTKPVFASGPDPVPWPWGGVVR